MPSKNAKKKQHQQSTTTTATTAVLTVPPDSSSSFSDNPAPTVDVPTTTSASTEEEEEAPLYLCDAWELWKIQQETTETALPTVPPPPHPTAVIGTLQQFSEHWQAALEEVVTTAAKAVGDPKATKAGKGPRQTSSSKEATGSTFAPVSLRLLKQPLPNNGDSSASKKVNPFSDASPYVNGGVWSLLEPISGDVETISAIVTEATVAVVSGSFFDANHALIQGLVLSISPLTVTANQQLKAKAGDAKLSVSIQFWTVTADTKADGGGTMRDQVSDILRLAERQVRFGPQRENCKCYCKPTVTPAAAAPPKGTSATAAGSTSASKKATGAKRPDTPPPAEPPVNVWQKRMEEASAANAVSNPPAPTDSTTKGETVIEKMPPGEPETKPQPSTDTNTNKKKDKQKKAEDAKDKDSPKPASSESMEHLLSEVSQLSKECETVLGSLRSFLDLDPGVKKRFPRAYVSTFPFLLSNTPGTDAPVGTTHTSGGRKWSAEEVELLRMTVDDPGFGYLATKASITSSSTASEVSLRRTTLIREKKVLAAAVAEISLTHSIVPLLADEEVNRGALTLKERHAFQFLLKDFEAESESCETETAPAPSVSEKKVKKKGNSAAETQKTTSSKKEVASTLNAVPTKQGAEAEAASPSASSLPAATASTAAAGKAKNKKKGSQTAPAPAPVPVEEPKEDQERNVAETASTDANASRPPPSAIEEVEKKKANKKENAGKKDKKPGSGGGTASKTASSSTTPRPTAAGAESLVSSASSSPEGGHSQSLTKKQAKKVADIQAKVHSRERMRQRNLKLTVIGITAFLSLFAALLITAIYF